MTKISLPVKLDERLLKIAEGVITNHCLATEAAQNAVDYARRAGQLLNDAKALVPHGEWLPWLSSVGLPERTAQSYMRVSRLLANDPSKAKRVSDLPLRRAIQELSEPKKDKSHVVQKPIEWKVLMLGALSNIKENVRRLNVIFEKDRYSHEDIMHMLSGLHYVNELLDTLGQYDGSEPELFNAGMALHSKEFAFFNVTEFAPIHQMYRECGMFRVVNGGHWLQ